MIGIGIIGIGHFGAVHARAIAATDGVRLAAVCHQDLSAAKAFGSEYGATAYDDWRRLLDDASVEAVVIATPHHLHREMAVAACVGGKHVLLEKPMAPTVRECDAIIEAADEGGATLMIGHTMHFTLPCLAAREVIASGALGRPIIGSSAVLKLWMESNRRPWHLDPTAGGGMLMTAGIHALDRLIWLMDGKVELISAAGGTFFHNQQADDSMMMLLRFSDGRFGQVASVGYRDGAATFTTDLVCEHGTLRIDFDRGVSIGRGAQWREVPNSCEEDWMLKAVDREWQAMVAAIRDDTPVPVTGHHGRDLIACIEAALASAHERGQIAVVP